MITQEQEFNFDDVLKQKDRGKLGLNVGIPIDGLARLSNRIDNLQKYSYILIAGDTGSGKTGLSVTTIMSALRSSVPVYVQVLSLELAPVPMKLRMIANHWYHKFGETVSGSQLLSKGSNRITSTQEDKLEIVTKELTEIIDGRIDLRCEMINSVKGFQKHQLNFYSRFGEFKSIANNYKEYIPNDPDAYYITIVDNISNFTSRELINDVSKSIVQFRNQTGGIYIALQQYSADMEKSMTAAGKSSNMRTIREPILTDLGDSKATARDAELVLMMFYPARYGATSFQGWNIKEGSENNLGEIIRGIKIAKARDGSDSGTLSFALNGAANVVGEMPPIPPSKKEYPDEFYERLMNKDFRQLLNYEV